MAPVVVVGLGNPGTEYEATRHNVGFRVVDTLAGRWKKAFKPGKGDYLVARAEIAGHAVVLVKPLTYLNNSGAAVMDVLKRWEAGIESLLVILDDIALPLGSLRLRARGSDGGHNGLYSIIYQLQSDEVARLRCGVGQEELPRKGMMADFVLSSFTEAERKAVDTMIVSAADAATEFIAGGIARAMNRFNT